MNFLQMVMVFIMGLVLLSVQGSFAEEKDNVQQPARRAPQSALIGNPAPDFTLPTLFGKTKTFSEMVGGKRSMVYFWATWCANCHEKLQYFQKMQDTFAQKNIVLAVVHLGGTAAEVQEYMQDHGIVLDTFLDLESSLEKKYQLNAVPTMVFVTPEGMVMNVTHSMPHK